MELHAPLRFAVVPSFPGSPAVGDSVVYSVDGRLYTWDGSVWQTGGSSPGGLQVVVLENDVINSGPPANTIANVTGLSFLVTAGVRYWFRAVIQYTAAATATGSRWSVSGPAAPTALRYRAEYSLTVTTRTTIEGSAAYDLPAASNLTSAATAANVAVVEGFIQPSADGTVVIRFASEVNGSAITAKAGSILQWMSL